MKKLCLLILICTGALPLSAAASGRDPVREAAIEQQLAKLNPALVAPFHAASVAFDREDFAEAERQLTGVVQQAPTFDPALRRLGSAMSRNGKPQEGIKLVKQAVALNRSTANLLTLAYVLGFPKQGEASDADRRAALDLLLECRNLPDGQDDDVLAATAQLEFQTGRIEDAREAVGLLQRKYPDLMQTHFYAAYLAAQDEHWITAEDEMHAALKLGLPPAAAQEFLDGGIHTRALIWRSIYGIAWVVAVWAAGLGVLWGLGYLLSNRTLRQIERADPRVAVSPDEHRLRRLYRAVLNVAGVYYYISLPIVLLLVVLVSGAVLYAFFSSGYIPIKLTALLVIGVFVTIWTMGKSLFLRVKAQDPGRVLARAEAEGLWKLSEQVARDLDTRPIDEIRITPGTDLCVYERGSWREKLENRAQRVLVVGAGVLNGFKVADFRSVLAHEYGHFSNRDTAGGDIALRVRNDMINFYVAMARAGQATWLNVAFHFLRFYNFVFVRISHGATRLQEVLADRVAALRYGPASFEAGLRHVIRRNVDFDFLADREIKSAVKGREPILNLYTAPDPQPDSTREKYAKAIERPTTLLDTHPGPQDRFRLIASLPEPAHPEATGLVWDLFKDRETIMREMMAIVEKNVAHHRP